MGHRARTGAPSRRQVLGAVAIGGCATVALPLVGKARAVAAEPAALPVGRPVYAGGTMSTGPQRSNRDLADPDNSTRFRGLGGRLYIHPIGFDNSPEADRRAIRDLFPAAPLLEGGVSDTVAETVGYLDHFVLPYWPGGAEAFIVNGLADQSVDYMRRLRAATAGKSRQLSAVVSPNGSRTDPDLANEPWASGRWDKDREMALIGGAITLDSPPYYYFAREEAYRSFVADQIQWALANGVTSYALLFPGSDPDWVAAYQRFVQDLEIRGALPDVWAPDCYYSDLPEARHPIGSDSDPQSTLGGALWLLERSRSQAEVVNRGTRTSLQVMTAGYTDRYLYDDLSFGDTAPLRDDATRRSSALVVRAGLADPDKVSLELADEPGVYLRHADYRIRFARNDGSELFAADATFRPVRAPGGAGVSFQSHNYPDRYIRHIGAQAWIANDSGTHAWDSSASFAADILFLPVPGSVSLAEGLRVSLGATLPSTADRLVRRTGDVAVAAAVTASADVRSRQDATFVLRRGLADGAAWSFESATFPGQFLRHRDYRLQVTTDTGGPFRADATFRAVTGLSGSNFSFQSVNYPDRYLRNFANGIWLGREGGPNNWDTTTNFAADATWHLGAGLA